MNEPPGARLRVGLSGLTVAEYFRDRRERGRARVHRQHLPLHAGGLGSVRAARPHAERRGLPADAGDGDGRSAGAHHVDAQRLDHVGAGDLRAGRRHHRSGAGDRVRAPRRDRRALARDHGARHLSRRRSARVVVAHSRSRSSSASATTRRRPKCSGSCSATRSCRTSSRSSAWTSCPKTTRSVVGRARRMQRFMSQPFAVAEQFTGIQGKYVKLEETISSFERLVRGRVRPVSRAGVLHGGRHRRRRRERRRSWRGLIDAHGLGHLAGERRCSKATATVGRRAGVRRRGRHSHRARADDDAARQGRAAARRRRQRGHGSRSRAASCRSSTTRCGS